MRIIITFLLFWLIPTTVLAGGDYRNANCWYDSSGKLFHSVVYLGIDGNYHRSSCPLTFDALLAAPASRTYTRSQWETVLQNDGRGPDFQDYARKNDREPTLGDGGAWWVDSYNQRQERDYRDNIIRGQEIQNGINGAIQRHLEDPNGLEQLNSQHIYINH